MACIGGLSDYELYRDSSHRAEDLEEQLKIVEAALCAFMTLNDKLDDGVKSTLVEQLDFKEAGITPAQLNEWWKEHKEQDRKRREKEAKEAERKKKAAAKKKEQELKEYERLKKKFETQE